ncbi:cytochrome P450 [Gymnopus androsaceus JB14]|uniref:Cytochrome P450 n=1 Tax=Gymnopus androsaceus JB14 TaxID=1447944 RepID=A0A6A4GRG7_9AGAR|nr:cytochrome P450 [Gymnopus androsaceus JB14]
MVARSNILHLDVLGSSIIVLNSLKAAEDLLEGRSELYSSRPPLRFLNEMMNLHWLLVVYPYGHKWRLAQKIFNRGVRPSAAQGFRPVQRNAVLNYLRRIRKDRQPEDVMSELRHSIGSTILSIAYGIKIKPSNDPLIALSEASNISINSGAMLPISTLMDIIPSLKYIPGWIPGITFKSKAAKWRALSDDMFEIPYAAGKRAMQDGTATPSFISAALEEDMDLTGLTPDARETIVKMMAATMYSGGVDATLATQGTFLLKVLTHPDIQRKAHIELDSVLERKRLPTFEDQASLPYITAIMREVQRMVPPAPLAFPHFIETDDIYEGYRIPAKSTVIMNTWAMLHDANTYPDPFRFNPDRFMKDGELNPEVLNPEHIIFGLGRRICPGRHISLSTQFMTIAATLSMYEIKVPIGKDGKEVKVTEAYQPGLVLLPESFSCQFVPRFEGAEDLLDMPI